MSILAWLIVGIIAGFLAKYVVPGPAPRGVIGDLVVGVVGALIGGFVFNLFGEPGAYGLNLYSIIVAVIGAVIFLWILRATSPRRVV